MQGLTGEGVDATSPLIIRVLAKAFPLLPRACVRCPCPVPRVFFLVSWPVVKVVYLVFVFLFPPPTRMVGRHHLEAAVAGRSRDHRQRTSFNDGCSKETGNEQESDDEVYSSTLSFWGSSSPPPQVHKRRVKLPDSRDGSLAGRCSETRTPAK